MLFLGFLICAGIAYWAFMRNALTPGGALAAVAVGTTIFGLGGAVPGLGLLAFFLSSTALSRYRRGEKEKLTHGVVEKGDSRDAVQVLANGGPAALYCVAFALTGQTTFYVAALAALAAANADTWATEIGLLSPTAPRDVLTFDEVPAGTSGAVSSTGLVGTAAGALFIGLLALFDVKDGGIGNMLIIAVGGIAGGFGDSLLGATIQERRQCLDCGATTEQLRHSCDGETVCVAGISGIGNDAVNAIATAWGGAIGGILCALLAMR